MITGCFAGELNGLFHVSDLVAFACCHENLDGVRGVAGQLVVEVNVGDVERDVLSACQLMIRAAPPRSFAGG